MALQILLIDDDCDDREIFCEALEILSELDVCHAVSNGERAFELLSKIDLPQLIFLDINMPVMNGWECLKRLKRDDTYREIPVIMYSTSSYHEDIEKARKLGALCFFSKPHDFKELKNSLHAVILHLQNGNLELLTLHSSSFVRA